MKEILFIGHSYHKKTKSSQFFIDILSKNYKLDIFYNESWENGKGLDFSVIENKEYFAIIFWQLLPPFNYINRFKCKNLIYVPMYDHSGLWSKSKWIFLRRFKIINFSKTLHEKHIKWGLNSISVRYFPHIEEFCEGNSDEIFFWQRQTNFNFETLKKLMGDKVFKVHIHKALDPNQEFYQPSKEDEEKYSITYSTWFDSKVQMWNVINQKAIYVAPRPLEGIGMSFLEAMSRGKAVIAIDAPTMNEYIENGKNGYLFDIKNLVPIDFLSIKEIQKNTFDFMKNGQEIWQNSINDIFDFIEQKPKKPSLSDIILCMIYRYYPKNFFKNLFEIKWSKRRGKMIKIFGIIIFRKEIN